jgi:hypothetical protein
MRNILFAIIIIFTTDYVFAFDIRGIVLDDATNLPIQDANIYVPKTHIGVITNKDGSFFVQSDQTLDTLIVMHIAYDKFVLSLTDSVNLKRTLLIKLSPRIILAPSVAVSAFREQEDAEVKHFDPGAVIFNANIFYNKPFIAEPDFIRLIQNLPGVIPQNELSAQLFIRGSSSDQNLMILDEIPITQNHHLLGIFSVFNSSMVQQVNFLPGGFSVQYGNYLGSVTKVKTRFKWGEKKGECVASLLSSSLFFESDIKKIHWSISLRRTYLDQFLKIFDFRLPFYFYDIYSKIGYQINKNMLLKIGILYSKDLVYNNYCGTVNYSNENETSQFYYSEKKQYRFPWASLGSWASFEWMIKPDLLFTTKVSQSRSFNSMGSETSLSFISGDYKLFEEKQHSLLTRLTQNFDIKNLFTENTVLFELNKTSNKSHSFRFGAQITRLNFDYVWKNFNYEPDSDIQLYYDFAEFNSDFNYRKNLDYYSTYLEYLCSEKSWFSIRSGLRFEKLSSSYTTLSPRINSNIQITKSLALKLACGKYFQSCATARERGVLGFLDLQFPTSPEIAEHYVAEIAYSDSNRIVASLSFYYKNFSNLLKAIGPRPDFTHIKGYAKGIELSLDKNWKTTSFNLAYTHAVTMRKYNQIVYPAPYDVRNRINIGVLKQIKNWTLSLVWNFATGVPFIKDSTFALYRNMVLDNKSAEPIFKDGTQFQMAVSMGSIRYPTNHRLDIGIAKELGQKRWSIAPFLQVYNCYNNKNVLIYRTITPTKINASQNGKVIKNISISRTYDWIPFLPTIGIRIRL